MKFSRQTISLICCRSYKTDPVICAFKNIFSEDFDTALEAYSSVCEALFSENKTLSDYIFFLSVNGENPIMRNYIKYHTNELFKALSADISVLSAIAQTDFSEITDYIKNKFNIDNNAAFPEYSKGDTVISADAVISFCERFGNSYFAYNKAFIFENKALTASPRFDDIRLSDLKKYELQRKKLVDNTICFINGTKAQNALLYGDRGTGKSSTVKAVVNEYSELRIIQITKSSICDIYKIYDIIKDNPLKFILFLDDITFSEIDAGYSFLKQVLEGSVMPIPKNCLIYATTNRRHIIKETESERTGDEMHAADARDENMSLADRFGLYITFSSPNKSEYLDIVEQLADDREIDIPKERLFMLAERFALKKCGRSPRTARQFIDTLKAYSELGMETDTL